MAKVYKTKRLFFGKWPFKVETQVPGAAFFMRRGADETRKFCLGLSDSLYRPNYSDLEKKKLLQFISDFEKLSVENIKVRAEWNTLNFYTDTFDSYSTIKKTLEYWIVKLTEPANLEELELLMNSNTRKVMCNKLPYDKFQYRIVLKPSMPTGIREKFLEWANNFPDAIQSTEKTLQWLHGEQRYLQDPYIYVEDPKQITFIKLLLGQYIARCEEYVVRDTQKAVK